MVISISSDLMTNLLEWRNPGGADAQWMRNVQVNRWNLMEILATEAALPFIAVCAIAESVALVAVLTFSSMGYLFLACVDEEEAVKFKPEINAILKHLSSASFTIIWSVVNFTFANFIYYNVFTSEACARCYSDGICNWNLLARREDHDYLRSLLSAEGPESIENLNLVDVAKPSEEELIEQGTHFLLEDVLVHFDAEAMKAFREMDHETRIFQLITARAVYEYAFGSKKDKKIPGFLCEAAIGKIEILRTEVTECSNLEALTTILALYTTTLKTYQEGSDTRKKLKAEYNDYLVLLDDAAAIALQGSLLLTKCMLPALEASKNWTQN